MTKNTLKVSYEEITKEKKEKEISLPYYSKSKGILAYYNKISTVDSMVKVYVGNKYANIMTPTDSNSFSEAVEGEIISEEEFDNKFSEALNIINSHNTLRKSGYTKEQEEQILSEDFTRILNEDRI